MLDMEAFLQLNNLCVVWPGRVFICFAQGVTRLPELAKFWILRVLLLSMLAVQLQVEEMLSGADV